MEHLQEGIRLPGIVGQSQLKAVLLRIAEHDRRGREDRPCPLAQQLRRRALRRDPCPGGRRVGQQ